MYFREERLKSLKEIIKSLFPISRNRYIPKSMYSIILQMTNSSWRKFSSYLKKCKVKFLKIKLEVVPPKPEPASLDNDPTTWAKDHGYKILYFYSNYYYISVAWQNKNSNILFRDTLVCFRPELELSSLDRTLLEEVDLYTFVYNSNYKRVMPSFIEKDPNIEFLYNYLLVHKLKRDGIFPKLPLHGKVGKLGIEGLTPEQVCNRNFLRSIVPKSGTGLFKPERVPPLYFFKNKEYVPKIRKLTPIKEFLEQYCPREDLSSISYNWLHTNFRIPFPE
jgi:hypothetical protein